MAEIRRDFWLWWLSDGIESVLSINRVSKQADYFRAEGNRDYMTVNLSKITKSFLTSYFSYEFYESAIQRIRNDIANNSTVNERFSLIEEAVRQRVFATGVPLELVNYGANQVLDENSDDEAYFWLDKMIYNIRREDEKIDIY